MGTAQRLCDVERELVVIWSRVLDRDGIRVTDNFYALGGHAALLMHVGAAITEAFGVSIPQRVLFDGTDIETLGRIVTSALVERIQQLDPSAAAHILDTAE